MSFLSNFAGKIIFMSSVNFWHQQDSNSLFIGSIGDVTSLCRWPIPRKSNDLFRQKRVFSSYTFSLTNGITLACLVSSERGILLTAAGALSWISHWTRKLSWLFRSHKMYLPLFFLLAVEHTKIALTRRKRFKTGRDAGRQQRIQQGNKVRRFYLKT